MLILAIDTSGKQGSVALAQGETDATCKIVEVAPLAGGTFSAQLIPQIAALLTKNQFTKDDIAAFAAISGPGSFTGLRTGLAAIKALAEVLNKPIAMVSLLAAIAAQTRAQGRVIAALDAGRNEIYAGEYEVSAQVTMLRERLLSVEDFLSLEASKMIITPDPTISKAARDSGREVEQIERPSSESAARLGWKKILSGETISPEGLEANYIRRAVELSSKNVAK